MEQAQHLARLAFEETRLGVLEDKAIKNMVATEFVYNYIRDKRTVGGDSRVPGTRHWWRWPSQLASSSRLRPLRTPRRRFSSNASWPSRRETRSSSVHTRRPGDVAMKRCRSCMTTALKHGAPEGVFTCVESPTMADIGYLMQHKDVSLIDATGGRSAVKAAYSSGKPALGVGPGNTPVYLEKTADLNMAVVDIITSKTFDNGTICASEQTVVIDDEIYDLVLKKFAELGAHICNEQETALLGRTVIDPETGFMRPMAVGQKATDIARFIGLVGKAGHQTLDRADPRCGPRTPALRREAFPGACGLSGEVAR